jgi:hypothetical protein
MHGTGMQQALVPAEAAEADRELAFRDLHVANGCDLKSVCASN